MPRIRVLVVDDHEIVRQGVSALLAAERDLEVVGAVGSAEEAVAAAARSGPDVAVVDIRLGGMSGIELCRQMRDRCPGTAVLILSSFISDTLVRECVEAGARGYLLKDVEGFDLVRAVRAVVRGDAALAPQAAALLMETVKERRHEEEITPEELQLLRLIAEGATNREIAARLFLSESAVKDRVLALFRKLKVRGRVEAVMEGVRRGLL
ncbi:MAG: response regulator transcription factor [Bacillota bacterium]|nr:response regulator transcription factor [Bacillota bacterium]